MQISMAGRWRIINTISVNGRGGAINTAVCPLLVGLRDLTVCLTKCARLASLARRSLVAVMSIV